MKFLAELTTGAVEHPLVTLLVGSFLALLGLFSAVFLLPIQQEPPIQIPIIIVNVPYPGASPWEVQSEITRELEDKLKGLENVSHIYSTATDNVSVTTIQFGDDVNVDEAKKDVRDRVDQAKVEFPKESEEPLISDVDFEDMPVLFLTLSRPAGGKKRDEILVDLNKIAENVEDRILQIQGISTVDTYGDIEKEVRIRIDRPKMEALGLSFASVARAIADQNVSFPGGVIETGSSTFSVRLKGKFDNPETLGDVIVSPLGAPLIHLKEIVSSYDSIKKATSYSRMHGRPSVTLVLHGKTGKNIIRLIRGIKAAVAEMRENSTIPPGVETTFTKNQSFWIWLMITQLGSSALFGGILVVIVLYFGMGMRSGFILASAIPFSVLFCFLCQAILDISINNMTLFSLILILGMVVDGAIVVGENIYRHFEMGKRPKKAALDGVHEVGIAVISADLTTISAFLPMLFMTGTLGFWMEIMPQIVSFTLIGSILVDHFFLPVLARYFMRVTPVLRDDEKLKHRWTYFLARHRIFSFILCFAVAGPIERGVNFLASVHFNLSPSNPVRLLSLFVIAVMLDYFLRRILNKWYGHRPDSGEKETVEHIKRMGGPFSTAYMTLLRFSLTHKGPVLVLAGLGLLFSFGLPASGRLRMAFFDDMDMGWYFIRYQLPPGTSLEENYRFAADLEKILEDTILPCRCIQCGWKGDLVVKSPVCPKCGGKVLGELKSTVTTLGKTSAMAAYMGDMSTGGTEYGQIEIELFPKSSRLPVERKVDKEEYFSKSPVVSFFQRIFSSPGDLVTIRSHRTIFELKKIQEKWLKGRFPGVKLDIYLMNTGPPVGAPIVARVRGRRLSSILDTSEAVENILNSMSDCTEVSTTHREGKREISVVPMRDRAAIYGLSPMQISRALFTAFQGWEISKITIDDEEVKIRLEADEYYKKAVSDVMDMELAVPGGGTVPLHEIAKIETRASVSSLKRFDRRQSVTVTSRIVQGADTESVKQRAKDAINSLPLPPGVSIEFGGQEEEQAKSVKSLMRAFIIAIILIFFILTGQFGSFKQPLVVMFTIPLAIVGAVTGLYITGNPLDFLAMVGIVCLTGIVVNDAIVLVDFLNKLRRNGTPVLDAVMLAGKARLRPILMTTITTVVGLLPLTLNLTGGGDFWQTMGVSIIFGLILATTLTLVVIPVLYTIAERDSWEAGIYGKSKSLIYSFLHRRKIRKALLKYGKCVNDADRKNWEGKISFLVAADLSESMDPAESLVLLSGRDYKNELFRRSLMYIETLNSEKLPPFAAMLRHLSGCSWRVDARLGEHQREITGGLLRQWLKFGGRRAPITVV